MLMNMLLIQIPFYIILLNEFVHLLLLDYLPLYNLACLIHIHHHYELLVLRYYLMLILHCLFFPSHYNLTILNVSISVPMYLVLLILMNLLYYQKYHLDILLYYYPMVCNNTYLLSLVDYMKMLFLHLGL